LALRIVLIDDDESLAVLLQVSFERDKRFELVGWAKNGLEGVQRVRELRPDVVLTDLNMPVMGGVAATRLILRADPKACVIAFTGSEDKAVHAAALQAGAAAVLTKPFDPDAFLDAFETHARRCTGSHVDAA
jgi:CheY-like chemotaxis protein